MADTGIKELLEAGVHFGHQTRRWNPSMRSYIHGERDGIHIIDLLQTEVLLAEATQVVSEIASRGGKVLFVGTKKQARDSVEEWAKRSGMHYVSRRWLGGLLTNYKTISKRIARLHELNGLVEGGQIELLPTKERMAMEAELAKLEFNLGGVRDMQRPPEAVVVIDLNAEEIAVAEASRLGIPIIGLVDTNCDPSPVQYVIPGNDDAIRSCDLIIRTLGEAIASSASAWQKAEEARIAREEEERRKREEERRHREAEEAARKAEEEARAKAQADARAAEQQAQASGEQAPREGRPERPAPRRPRGKPVPKERQARSEAPETAGQAPAPAQGEDGEATPASPPAEGQEASK